MGTEELFIYHSFLSLLDQKLQTFKDKQNALDDKMDQKIQEVHETLKIHSAKKEVTATV
jgi:hypothetical protein